MKKILLSFGFGLIVTSGVFAQASGAFAQDLDFITTYPLVTVIAIIAHICLTYAVYKKKGGLWPWFYFFLAPLAILILITVVFTSSVIKAMNSRD